MKNIIKVLFFNIIFLIVFFILFELIGFYIENDHKLYVKTSFPEFFNTYIKDQMRKPVGLEYTKKAIILFGCSYTHGDLLREEQTFSYKLSQYTKRPVFNKAYSALSTQHMYWQTLQPEFYESITRTPEYAIYVCCNQLHLLRLHRCFLPPSASLDIRYTLAKNNVLKEFSTPFDKFYNLQLVKFLYNTYFYSEDAVTRFTNRDIMLMKQLIIQSKEELQKHYPDLKFVVLYFNDRANVIDSIEPLYYNQIYNTLEDYDIKFIDTADLVGFPFDHNYLTEYAIENDGHPNEKVWDLIVPKLAEELNL